MGTIAKAFTITGFGMIAASAIGLVKTRVIATLQGTEGVGLLGQFLSLHALIAGIAALGLGTGLIKYLSQYLESNEYDRISKSVSSAISLVICTSISAAIILIVLSKWISSLLVGDDSAWLYVTIIAISIPLASLTTIFNSLINGARAIKPLARASVYSQFVALLVAVPAVYFLGKIGVIIQIVTAAAIVFIINFSISREIKKTWPVDIRPFRFDAEESKLLLHYGAVSTLTGLMLPLTLLITQTAVIRQEGLSENGLFTASWSLFWLYVAFATTSVVTYLFPTMSATKENRDLSLQVNNGVRFLAIATTPISCLIVLIPGTILTLLYSPEFADASWLLQMMAIAGAFRIISFPISITLVAKKRLKEYLPIEVSWYLVFAGVVITLLPTMGIEAIGLAVLAAYIIHTVLFVVFVKRILGLFYWMKNWIILTTSTVLIISLFVVNIYDPFVSYVFGALTVPIWLYYATDKAERRWAVSKLLRKSS